MKIADLYIRVSTDEQADRGYSQRNQQEVLRKYCEINAIQIRKVWFEDHSAKTFTRPEWSKLLLDLKKNRNKSNLILFTKWDRFSRNAGDAYQMISILRKIGIEPQAIEQPLDLSIPENKMMLAFYLAAPEVENDRRALNTFHGMRRAKKEGRAMGSAPVGYANKVTEDGRKYIALKEPEASIIKWAFQELEAGVLAADQIRKQVNQKGVKCSRSNFWRIIRNPIYCGKILVPQYKDEEARLVEGQHQPLISESLFYDVQDVLEGKKRKKVTGTKVTTQEAFPLRGFLICPKCGRTLTASASKGKYYRYNYYHCISKCGHRTSANIINDSFAEHLKKFVLNPVVAELYKLTITNTFKTRSKHSHSDHKNLILEITKLNERLTKAREFLLSGDLDPADYKIVKTECDEKINRLEVKLNAVTNQTSNINTIEKLLGKAVVTLSNLHLLYLKADVVKKREIISSIYPEKITFDGFHYRTPRMNEAANLIFQINNDLPKNTNGKEDDFSHLSRFVTHRGIEPLFQP